MCTRSRWCLVAGCVCCFLSLNSFADPLSKDPPIDLNQYDQLMSSALSDVYDLEQYYVDQQYFFLPIIPPDPEFTLLQQGSPEVLPCDLSALPRKFQHKLKADYENSVPVYPIVIFEDPITRYVYFANRDWKIIYAIPPIIGYNPYAYLADMFPWLYAGKVSKEKIEYLQRLYDPARVQIKTKLINVKDVEQYLYVQKRIVDEHSKMELLSVAESMLSGGMLMSMGTDSNIVITAVELNSNTVTVTIGYPNGFTNRLELFSCMDLMAFNWELAETNMVTAGTNEIHWVDTGAGAPALTNIAVLYAVGNADIESDGDSLIDAREFFLYRTDMNDADTDNDELNDGEELFASYTDPLDFDTDDDTIGDGYDPQPTNSSVSHIYLTITTPADGVVLGGYE